MPALQLIRRGAAMPSKKMDTRRQGPRRPLGGGRPCAAMAAMACLCLPLPGCLFPDVCADGHDRAAQQAQDTWTRVPPQWKGDDIVGLVKELCAERGEYESSAAYSERIRRIAEKKARYAFAVEPSADGLYNFIVEYSPDDGRFAVNVTADWDSSMLLAQTESRRDALLARNASGRGVRVADLTIDRYSIVLTNESLGRAEAAARTIYSTGVGVPPARAPGYKGRIRVLLVAALVPGRPEAALGWPPAGNRYYGREHYLSDALLPYPMNLNEYSHFLYASLESIWVYDGLTGAVLGRCDVAEGDARIRQARQALAEGRHFTAEALVSGLPDAAPAVRAIREGIEAARLERAAEEDRRLAEARRSEQIRNHGPAPEPAVVRRMVREMAPRLMGGPCDVLSISALTTAIATIGGEPRALWQVKAEVRDRGGQAVRHLYVYIKYDEVLGHDLI